MYSKRLVQVGNSVALVIETPVLRRLGLRRGAIVEYLIEDGRLVIQRSKREPPELEVVTGKVPTKPRLPLRTLHFALESLGFGEEEAKRLVGDRWGATSLAYVDFWTKVYFGQYGELIELQLRALHERLSALGPLSFVPVSQTLDEVLAAFPAHPPHEDGVRFEHLL